MDNEFDVVLSDLIDKLSCGLPASSEEYMSLLVAAEAVTEVCADNEVVRLTNRLRDALWEAKVSALGPGDAGLPVADWLSWRSGVLRAETAPFPFVVVGLNGEEDKARLAGLVSAVEERRAWFVLTLSGRPVGVRFSDMIWWDGDLQVPPLLRRSRLIRTGL